MSNSARSSLAQANDHPANTATCLEAAEIAAHFFIARRLPHRIVG